MMIHQYDPSFVLLCLIVLIYTYLSMYSHPFANTEGMVASTYDINARNDHKTRYLGEMMQTTTNMDHIDDVCMIHAQVVQPTQTSTQM